MSNDISRAKETKKTKKTLRSKILLTICILFFLAAVGVLFYPTIMQQVDKVKVSIAIDNFDKNVAAIKDDSKDNHENSKYNKELLDQLYKDMKAYNKNLYDGGQVFGDPFMFEQSSFDLTSYGIEDSIFGYIKSPNVYMDQSLFLGASYWNLSFGAAHMTGTSVPIGGVNTNSVIAGHTGVAGYTFFDNIVGLEVGNDIYVTNFWDELHYKVIEAKVILPNETSDLRIEEGKDLLTLLTCYPYGENTHRFVVICERVN